MKALVKLICWQQPPAIHVASCVNQSTTQISESSADLKEQMAHVGED